MASASKGSRPAKWQRALGLLFLFITAASWIGASFITQALVSPGDGNDGPEMEPWLLTLICSSTFLLYLPVGLYGRRGKRSKAHRDAGAGSGKLPGSLATDSTPSHTLATGPTTPIKPIPGCTAAPELSSPGRPPPLPGSRALGNTGSPTHGSRDGDSDTDGSGPDEYDPESPDPDGNGSGSGWVVPTRGSHGSSGSGNLRERQPLLARGLAGGGERGTPGSASSAGSSMRSVRDGEARRGGGGPKQVVHGGEHAHVYHHLGHGHGGHGHGQGEGGRGGGLGGEGGCCGGGGGEEEGEGDLKTRDVVRAAMLVAPVWLAAQFSFTASLQFTSVTSNTVLSSCASLFVYLGSLAMGQERGSMLRLCSVLAAMAGIILVTLGDSRGSAAAPASSPGPALITTNATLLATVNAAATGAGASPGSVLLADGGGGTGGGSMPLLGDALTLLAAALYAAYTVVMKRLLVKDDGAVMALFFGVLGVLCAAVLLPVVCVLWTLGSPVVTDVTARALGLALVQGLIDYVAADYAWARAVMLLGPTVTSCGLAMQIPAAGLLDAALNGGHLAWSDTAASLAQFIVGSLLIIGGFMGVSVEPRVIGSSLASSSNGAGTGAGGGGLASKGGPAGGAGGSGGNGGVVGGAVNGQHGNGHVVGYGQGHEECEDGMAGSGGVGLVGHVVAPPEKGAGRKGGGRGWARTAWRSVMGGGGGGAGEGGSYIRLQDHSVSAGVSSGRS